MINMTLPDDKANYTHRIGRGGRAERMGLAISLVAQLPEKVWYHGEWCKSRGKGCTNTRYVPKFKAGQGRKIPKIPEVQDPKFLKFGIPKSQNVQY